MLLFIKDWISYILSKIYYLDAAYLVRYAMVNYDNCKYGEQLSCLIEAEKQMFKCKNLKSSLQDDYYEDLRVNICI